MPTDSSYCPAPGCGRLLRGERCECGWAPADAPPEDGERRPCPDCAELVLVAARVCRFCGADLERAARKGRPPSGRRGAVARRAPVPAVSAPLNAPFAAVMSLLIPGLGQLYAGATARGGVMFAAAVIAWALAFSSRPDNRPLFVMMAGAVALGAVIDAYALASRQRR